MTTTQTQVLCVDLERSLVRTDPRWESIARTIAPNPLLAIRAAARSASRTASSELRDPIDASSLPLNPRVLEFVRKSRDRGDLTMLLADSPESSTHDFAQTLDAFDGVVSTTSHAGRSAESTAEILVEKFGVGRFTYLGSSLDELPVWRRSGGAVTIDAPAALTRELALLGIPHEALRTPAPSIRTWMRLLRVHQWIKNVLVFVPLVVSWRDRQPIDVLTTFVLFVAFCLLASAVYVFNDIGDLRSDRGHLTKRYRPLASGEIAVKQGLVAAVLLAVAAFVVASFTNPLAVIVLALYGAATLGYSASFKRIAIADVIVLAGLYTVRVIAGCAVLMVIPSVWLVLFSVFIFFSLALMKRCADFAKQDPALAGRGYVATDEVLLVALGTASGLVSVMVLGLYINSLTLGRQYQTPALLWLDVPLLLFWISRAWLLTHRGSMKDDPVVFALHDRVSQASGALMLLIAALAMAISL